VPDLLVRFQQRRRPNLIPGCDVHKTHAGVSKLDEYFNLDCYTLQQFGTFGNARLGQLAAPGMARADISMIKEFDLHENYKLQLRMEGFNITNHPSLGMPNSNVGCTNYLTDDQQTTLNHTPGASCNAAYLYNALHTPPSGGLTLNPAVSSCQNSRTAAAQAGPPGGGPIACITSTQGVNRQFQFALKLTF